MPNIGEFTREYVLAITRKHVLHDIDTSINKTLKRIGDFEGNSEISFEVLKTLNQLQQLRNIVTGYLNE
jgi:hypothetical protein